MRALILGTVLLGALGTLSATTQTRTALTVQSEMARALGELPRSGDLTDILRCAGANDRLWTTAMQADPRDPEAHEARRKAGWYSAVALWVFEVESAAVVDAVKSASERERATVFEVARKCRPAPENWRE